MGQAGALYNIPCMGASLQPSVLATGSSEGAAAASAPGKELQRTWQGYRVGRDPLLGALQPRQSVHGAQVCTLQ